MGVMPLGPLVRLIGLSRLLASTRIDLAEAEGHDGQVVAVQPQHRQAEQHAGDGRHREPDEEEDVEPAGRQREAAAEDQVGVRRAEDRPGVRADREEGHVAEVEQAGQADHDVQSERQRHEDPDLDRHLQVVAVE